MDSDDYHNEFSFYCLCAYTYILSFEEKKVRQSTEKEKRRRRREKKTKQNIEQMVR